MPQIKISAMQGFSLIELLIALGILGIIAAIALPNYSAYSLRANRTEGLAQMNNIMQAQERYYAEERSYTADLTDLGYSTAAAVPSENGRYTISAAACAGTTLDMCVNLVATPSAAQAGDDNGNGGALSLNSRGEKVGVEH